MHKRFNPFSLLPVPGQSLSISSPVLSWAYKAFRRPVEYIFGLNGLAKMYDSLPEGLSREQFVEQALKAMKISYEIADNSSSAIPATGPAIIVANHPFGGIEGVVLANLLSKIRPDFKIMANAILGRVPEMRDFFIMVDPFGTESSPRKNIQPLREAIEYVEKGGLLAVFPSGTVSHLQVQRREVSDPKWSATIGRVIRRTKAPVVPLYFSGSNGLFFQLLGLIHPLLRTAMLPREMFNKCGSTLRLRIGKCIPFEKLSSFSSDEKMISYLRIRSYILADSPEPVTEKLFGKLFSSSAFESNISTTREPVVKPEPTTMLLEEIDLLPKHQLLLEGDGNQVFYAKAPQIPHILREIGRLREITFREAQEGTGKSLDLDRFDNYYVHLFVWNQKNQEIVGAYRMGKTDVILRRYGMKGLYTSTLFNYKATLMDQISPALELGRSFVRKEYQKNYSSLLLLWKGIGRYVANHPRYTRLFGPVSINNEYESISRQLITQFLKANNFDPELARMIKAKNPLRGKRIRGVDPEVASVVVGNIDQVSELLAEIETTQKAVPVLLRQYLKLGGKLLGFNLDPSFGGVLDGLILVDLLETEDRLLQRYLGKEAAEEFVSFHQTRKSRVRKRPGQS